MIEYVGEMLNWEEQKVDVLYNKETKELYQNCLANKYQAKTVDGKVLLGTFDTKWDSMVYLEEEFGSAIKLQ